MKTNKYTIIAISENKPGVLYRLSDLFLKRKINIESLTVSELAHDNKSRFTIVINNTEEAIEKIVKQIYKIIEVTKVEKNVDQELIFKELALIKVNTSTPDERREIEQLAYLFQAQIIYVGSNYLVLEKSGSEEEIDSLYSLLKAFHVKEFVRSGRIAVAKDMAEVTKFGNMYKDTAEVTSMIEVSAIKKVELLARATPDVISLAQGIPSFFTAEHIRTAAKNAIDNNLSDKYTPGYGIPELRSAIVDKLKRDNKINCQVEQVVVTHGGIEGLIAVFMALLNPEDEVLILTPDYASHITQVRIARHGGRPIFVPLTETENGWELAPEKIESAITQHTKAILICNPCNPTGKVYSLVELKEIARIAAKYNLYIISDEIYEYFVYSQPEHISIGSLPEAQDRTISIFGVSKSYAMTGWRIGYIVASQKLIKQIFKIHDSLITCPTAVSQYAALAAISGPQTVVKEYKEAFERRRGIVMTELSKTDKLICNLTQGAYYAFPKIRQEIDDEALAYDLIKYAKVAVVPGSAFGPGGENHVRISFGGDEEKLRIGLERLVNYLNNLI